MISIQTQVYIDDITPHSNGKLVASTENETTKNTLQHQIDNKQVDCSNNDENFENFHANWNRCINLLACETEKSINNINTVTRETARGNVVDDKMEQTLNIDTNLVVISYANQEQRRKC